MLSSKLFVPLIVASSLAIALPAGAYSISTSGINDYATNGGGGQLTTRVGDADGAGTYASGHGWTWHYQNNNSVAYYGLFADTTTGGFTGDDMAYFSGTRSGGRLKQLRGWSAHDGRVASLYEEREDISALLAAG